MRTKPTTTRTGRPNLQNDLGYILDNSGGGVILNDNSGNRILIHSGTFEDQDTRFTKRVKPTTILN